MLKNKFKKTTKTADHSAASTTASEAKATQSATTTVKAEKATKATKSKANDKYVVYGVCGAIMAVSIGVIVWAAISFLNKPAVSEETFATNDVQSTISLTPTSSDQSTGSTLVETHVVYQYDGDNVVGQKTYFEYVDAEAARAAYEARKDQPEFKGAELSDKYVIVTADPNQFKGLTADDIRQQAEAIKQFQESQKPKEEPTDQSTDEHAEESEEHHEDTPEEAPEE